MDKFTAGILAVLIVGAAVLIVCIFRMDPPKATTPLGPEPKPRGWDGTPSTSGLAFGIFVLLTPIAAVALAVTCLAFDFVFDFSTDWSFIGRLVLVVSPLTGLFGALFNS